MKGSGSPGHLLDPEHYSIDEVYAQFEAYKKLRQQQQLELKSRLTNNLSFSADLKELNSNMANLRMGMQQLQEQQKQQQQQRELLSHLNLDAIEPAGEVEKDCTAQNKESDPRKLVISCGVSKCLFECCQRHVDSQLLLLHYLCDHDQQADSPQRLLPVVEGERAVLSFQPQRCSFRVNQVLGLLAYGGTLEQQFAKVRRPTYNCFLPSQYSHLENHVPVVVLICRTAAHAALADKKLARGKRVQESLREQVFILWLVTPSDRIQLNATLCLCGRDAAVRASCVVGVRKVSYSQDTGRFMAVDANYWRLTYTEMDKLSNGFRDELNLEIGLTEPHAPLGVFN